MIVNYSWDGESIDLNKLLQEGFVFNPNRDFRLTLNDRVKTLNFVGVIVNKDNDIFSVFPKGYNVVDPEHDTKVVYDVIFNFLQKKPHKFFGELYDDKFDSNYPFAAFFGVYDYYSNFGFHFEDSIEFSSNCGGRINWKKTISNSQKLIVDNELYLFPIVYEKKYRRPEFLYACMVFVINYTCDKFGFLIGVNYIEDDSEIDLSNKQHIISQLIEIRQHSFSDTLLELVDNLIMFFSDIQVGGKYYLKHYAFNIIWEDVVKKFFNQKFVTFIEDEIKFGINKETVFEKKYFYPNNVKSDSPIIPDLFGEGVGFRYIFDSKYYSSFEGTDYKQLAYYAILSKMLGDQNRTPITKCGLVIPSNYTTTKLHFTLNDRFNPDLSDMVIYEVYLDINEAINNYLKG